MYQSKFYNGADMDPATSLGRQKIAESARSDGFNPLLITDNPGFSYATHQHPETKLLIFLEGSMKVTVDSEVYQCLPGDRLIIPGNTEHSAIAGKNGCSFYWAEK